MDAHEIKNWLDTAPFEEEVKTKGEGKYIPYHIIVEKLNKLSENWGTQNFHHLMYTVQGRLLISGSVEVVIPYFDIAGEPHTRILAGAATFVVSKDSNPHIAATVKSLAVMNAVKPLGKQFGWMLNPVDKEYENDYFPDENLPIIQSRTMTAGKAKPDQTILDEYFSAKNKGDEIKMAQLEAVYDFKL